MRNSKVFSLYFAAVIVAVLAVAATPAFASTSKYVGIYSAEDPDATDATAPVGPTFSLSLGKDGSATVTQDAGKGSTTLFGHWTESGSQVTVKFDAVGEQPANAPMVFEPSHDGLHAVTWSHTLWGKITPPVLKKEESNWHTNKKHGFL
jgi:hypothetical protein